MSDYLLGGFVIGVVFIVIYVVRERRSEPNLGTAAVLLISGIGITTGVRLMVICVTVKKLMPFGEEDRVYIFIGGLAVIWVSVEAIVRTLRAKKTDTR